MFRVLGSRKIFCDGITRRDALCVGGLSLLGFGTAGYALAKESSPATVPAAHVVKGRGKAKSCILLFLYGSPSQLEFADMKPDAPVEVRGELRGIPSRLSGCDVCELLPKTSRVMDKVTVVRSLNHPHPIHGVAYATSGVPNIDVAMELNPHDPRHWPFIGSVVSYLEAQKKSKSKNIPDNIALPWAFSTRRSGEVHRAGPYAAFLGSAYHPHYLEFHGKATQQITKTLNDKTITFDEPYVAIAPEGYFAFSSGHNEADDLTLDRLNERKNLLSQLEDLRRAYDSGSFAGVSRQRELAYSLLSSPAVREALDLSKVSYKTRESYGMTVFGQGCLVARRLVEAGSKFVTVFWDEFGLAGSGWDTHWEHYSRLKNELMPGFDMAFSGLINDLDQRGLLDETLVVVLSEHGRTPKLNKAKGAGRDHWSQAYTALFAGGGVPRGKVVGKTDKIGGTVLDRPISPKDVLATIYHLLGYDLETQIFDKAQRPYPLVPNASIIDELIA